MKRDPGEMAVWLASTKQRTRKLDKYEREILRWIREHPDLSSAQVADCLDERISALKVGEGTVRRRVGEIRKEHNIPKSTSKQVYEAIPDLPMGFQAQVDFGQC